MVIGRKSVLCLIGASIVIVFVSQAQISLKDEVSPLYEFWAVQAAEELGLAPTGSANSDLDSGSVATVDLTVTKPGERSHPGGESNNPVGAPCCKPGCGPGVPGCPPCVPCPQPPPDEADQTV